MSHDELVNRRVAAYTQTRRLVVNGKNMIVVIACAGSKDGSAGQLKTKNKQRVMFVSKPRKVPKDKPGIYKHPDDPAYRGKSWRNVLDEYNRKHKRNPSDNPLGLLRASDLYKPRQPYREIYKELVEAFGIQNVFILSAGWGLIPADFLTPKYDITFSQDVKKKYPYKHRDKNQDIYEDFKKLPSDTRKPIVFLGGDSYVSLFGSLTEHIKTKRIIFHKSKNPTKPPNCQLRHFEAKTKNRIWYYECAKELMAGNIDID